MGEPDINNIYKKDNLKCGPLPNGTILTYQYNVDGKDHEEEYIVTKSLNAGGFGWTYMCRRRGGVDIGKPVVIKEFCPVSTPRNKTTLELAIDYNDEHIATALKDFQNEPQRINKLKNDAEQSNPNNPQSAWDRLNLVIPLTKDFENYGNHYYIMEYVEGDTLARYLQKNENCNQLTLEERLKIVREICTAIKNLHSIGCVHQDLSPNNVMIQKQNDGTFKVKVIDYGLSTTLFHPNSTVSFVRAGGSRGFSDVSDEDQYNRYLKHCLEKNTREYVKLIDIYSLGKILIYTCLASYDLISSRWTNNFLNPALEEEPPTDSTPEALKKKVIKDMIRTLAKDATNSDLEERAKKVGSIDVFIGQLEIIQSEWAASIISEPEKPTDKEADAEKEDMGEEPKDPLAEIRKKAESGDVNAQTDLGKHYEFGVEVPKDIDTAIQWYTQAAKKGNKFAKSALERLKKPTVKEPKKKLPDERDKTAYKRAATYSLIILAVCVAVFLGIKYAFFHPSAPEQKAQAVTASEEHKEQPETIPETDPINPVQDEKETKLTEEPREKTQPSEEETPESGKQQVQVKPQPVQTVELPKLIVAQRSSDLNLADLTPASLTSLMSKAQTDAAAQEQLSQAVTKSTKYLVMDEYGTIIELPYLDLYNNLKQKAYRIGETHRVDHFEQENGKITVIILTPINQE